MNLLALCNRLILECGISASPMTATANQTGELGRVVSWVQSALVDIESIHQDWQWLRKSASFTTVSGQPTYAPAADIGLTDFGMWAKNTFRNYVTSTGTNSEVFMSDIDYEIWRDNYYYSSLRNVTTRPMAVAIGPAKQLCLGPVPDAGYTVTGDYFRVPAELSSDSASPELPSQHHMIIVYRAMMFYGGFESAPEVYDRGELEYGKILARLSIDRLPTVIGSSALA